VVFFPLRLVARGVEAGVGFAGPRLFEPKPVRPSVPGPSLGPWVVASGLDDIGIGPAIRWDGFPTGDSKLLLAASWSTNDRRRVRFRETLGASRPVAFVLHADYDQKPTAATTGSATRRLGPTCPTSCSQQRSRTPRCAWEFRRCARRASAAASRA